LQLNKEKANLSVEPTSGHLSLALNLATRSCVVNGVFCIRTALISSSLTGPEAMGEEEPPLDDGVGGTPFEGVLFLDVDPFSSLTVDFGS